MKLHRRTLLGAGLASWVGLQRAHAAGTSPKRLILFHTPNGIELLRQSWPAALEKHRGDLLVVDGPDWKSVDKTMLDDDDHGHGVRASFTAWPLSAKGRGGPSLDQHLVAALKPETKFASLQLGVLAFGYGNDQLNARLDGSPIPADYKPKPLFDRLFGGATPATPGTPAAGDVLRARRKSVIDHLAGEVAAMKPTWPTAERRKLDAHLEALRALERRLTAPVVGATPAGDAVAALGARISAAKIPDYSPDYAVHYPLAAGIMRDMLSLALSSGLTRIATLRYSGAVSNIRHTWIGSQRGHHDLAHGGSAASAELKTVTDWYAGEFAALLERLKAVPEGGGTMLDNSLVVWSSDMANGNHGFKNGYFILAGRAGGALRTGRTLTVPGSSQNDLYVSVAQLMGANTTAFGNPRHCTGALPGVT